MTTQRTPGSKPASGSTRRMGAWAVGVGLAAFALLAYDRRSESYFLDESNYLVQGYHADLLLAGRTDDPAWLALPAIDQPPLMKYLVGLALRAGGYPRPGLEAALAWQRDYNLRPIAAGDLFVLRFATLEMLDAARWPATILGALGCAAVFSLGTLMRDRRVGLAAAALLALNPLYRQQAHRALSDVPCEALVLAASALALWAWRGCLAGRLGPAAGAAAILGAGVLGGLAILDRLTGVIVLMHVAAWTALALLLPRVGRARKAAVAVGAPAFALAAIATVVAGNPTLTAHPPDSPDPERASIARAGPAGRFLAMLGFRARVSALQQRFYPHYALESLPEKVQVTVVQGFGRFSPFGPAHSHQPVLYDWAQDRWAVAWIPWVALGAAGAAVGGRRQLRDGDPPTAWAILGSAALTLACVVGYVPLAWDRYFLPLQPWNALFAAWAAIAAIDAVRSAWPVGKQAREPGRQGSVPAD